MLVPAPGVEGRPTGSTAGRPAASDGSVTTERPPSSSPDSLTGPALQLVSATALDAVVVMRPDGLIDHWNRGAETIFGWRAEEAVGRLMSELIVPPQHRLAHSAGLRRYLETGEGGVLGKRIEITALRRTGEEFPIELSIQALKDEEGEIFLGFIRDISGRKAEKARLEAQAREAQLLHRVASLAAESTSSKDVIKTCLDAVCELTGWPLGHAFVPHPEEPDLLKPTEIWSGDGFEPFREVTSGTRFTHGQGLPGHVWKTGAPLWIEDAAASELFIRTAPDNTLGVRGAFAFPVRAGGRTVAILEFFSDAPQAPDPRLLLTARTIGDQAGRVLERQQASDHQELLLAELNHRVKNMLAVVIGVAGQTARTAASVSDFNQAFGARINALSAAYSLLTQAQWESTSLRELVEAVVAPHLGSHDGFAAEGPPVRLTPKQALTLSMVLHELSTNALKHGALARDDGTLDIGWRLADSAAGPRLALSWRERGARIDAPPARRGFGMRLIDASARYELDGRSQIDYKPDGLSVEIEFPLSRQTTQ